MSNPVPSNQNNINPKLLELGTCSLYTIFTTCNVSCAMCHVFFLVGGGSVINRAYPNYYVHSLRKRKNKIFTLMSVLVSVVELPRKGLIQTKITHLVSVPKSNLLFCFFCVHCCRLLKLLQNVWWVVDSFDSQNPLGDLKSPGERTTHLCL